MSRQHTKAGRRRSFREHMARVRLDAWLRGASVVDVLQRKQETAVRLQARVDALNTAYLKLARQNDRLAAVSTRLGASFDGAARAARRFVGMAERMTKGGAL